jgi:hypothetical protein
MSVHKLSHFKGDVALEHSYSPVFRLETTSAGTQRLVAGASGSDAEIFKRLCSCLKAPYFVLYVLIVPRGGEDGRYQSPLLEEDQLQSFLSQFSDFFSKDARHAIWVHSPESTATLIWDQHNLIYGYGSLDCYVSELRALGFSPGDPKIPAPHMHCYHADFDADQNALLNKFEWTRSELQPGDDP